VDVQQRLDEITASVQNARAMPMSASCVVNRAELLSQLGELREALPTELAHAQQTTADREQIIEEARREAERIITGAHSERGNLISDTEVARRAQAEADRILAEARAEAEQMRHEADDYVDSKLANFEVVLTKTLAAIGRGRVKLRGDGMPVEGENGEEFAQDEHRTPSPEVDEYVDAKLATLEAVLGKTLEAVGRGRDKLLGKRPIDELGAYLAAADEASGRAAAVAAGLAEAGLAAAPDPEPQPVAQEQQHYAYQQQWDQTGGYPVYDPQHAQQYGYPQHADPYAVGYAQEPAAAAFDYGPQQYDYPGTAYAGAEYHVPHQQQPQNALDETSFFDTSMIDMSRLRELGGGH
jgi:vacuolar-type H+-ATPase subunit H